MNYSMLAIFCIALSVAGIISISDDNKITWDNTDEESRAGQFMNYVSAFDDYYQKNNSATGDVTSSVTIPTWLPKSGNIKMVINSGIGYVYTPASKGMMREIMKWTANSSSVGVSDATNINTVSGKIQKPAFIGSGYIVYVR